MVAKISEDVQDEELYDHILHQRFGKVEKYVKGNGRKLNHLASPIVCTNSKK
jgi:hypothetical protein